MFKDKKIIVIMPAYNAAQMLRKTYDEVMAQGMVDQVIVVDDASSDRTAAIAKILPKTIVHTHLKNQGYGANQKSCYKLALEHKADIVIMVHPDYQYTPMLIPAMSSMISSINFRRCIRYGFGCLLTALTFRLAKMKLVKSKLFPVNG